MAHLRRPVLAAAGLAVAAALLLAAPAAAQPLQGPDDPTKDGVQYEWWDEEWHMRVPVLVRPQMPDAVVDGRFPVLDDVKAAPVHVEVDFTDVIRRVGDSPERRWPQNVDRSLDSFTFDKDSVRVVRYDRDSGRIRPHPATDTVVPSRFIPTLLEGRDLDNGRFDPSSNAVGTVTWITQGELDEPRLYFVYFDIRENGDKPAPTFTPAQRGALDSLYWIRPGTEAYGYVPETGESGSPAVEVRGLYEDTAVQVERYAGSGIAPKPVESCQASDSGLCVQGGDRLEDPEAPTFELQPLTAAPSHRRLRVTAPQDRGFFFHVTADKPVLVSVRSLPPPNKYEDPSQLFYPGAKGLVSRDFRFTILQDAPAESGPKANLDARIVAPRGPATVTWTYLDRGREAAESPIRVPGRGSRTVEFPPEAAGEAVRVQAQGNPVAIVKPGYAGHVGTQAPSPHGAPVGEATYAPAWEHVRAVPWNTSATVTSFDLQEPGDPDARVTGTGGPGPADDVDLRVTRDQSRFRGDVFWTAADEPQPLSTFHGLEGIVPVSGERGRDLRIPMGEEEPASARDDRLVVFPVADRTRVRVTQAATGTEVFNGTVGRDQFLARDPTTGDALLPAPGGYHVQASKPVLAYRVTDAVDRYGTYASTVSRSPLYEIGSAAFHGRLLRWDEALRTPTVAPGQEQRFTLSVTNLGREIGGGNLPDTIVIEQDVAGNGSVTLSTQKIRNLDSFESREVTVAVSIPEDAETGDSLVVNLTATSQGNPNFQATTQLKITVETLFRVEMTFQGGDCNPRSCERLVDAGSSTLYAIEVNNTGTGDDAYSFSLSRSQSGFNGRIQLPNGTVLATGDETRAPLEVPRGDSRIVLLNVSAPDTAGSAFPYEAVVQAVSRQDSSANAQVVATTVLSVNTEFRLEAVDEARTIRPGGNATFPVRAVNEGDATVLEVATSEPSLEGWNVSVTPRTFLLRANGTTAAGARGDVEVVNVTVTASPDADVGKVLPLEVSAAAENARDQAAREAVEVRAEVVNSFAAALSGLGPRSLEPGTTYRYRFTLRNTANGPYTAGVNATGLPDGWRFEKETPQGRRDLAVGESLTVAGDLILPPGSPAGAYNVTFSVFARSDEGRRDVRTVTGTVQVARRANLDIDPPRETVPVPPGNATRVPLEVTNAGNVDLETTLQVSTPPGWTATFLNDSRRRLTLATGATRTVDLALQAPSTIGDGPVDWSIEADLPLRSPETFAFQADWIRQDLRVADVQPVTEGAEPGSVAVVAVTLRQEGTVPANGVDVAVLDAGEVLGNATVETLPPGQDRLVRVEWVVPSDPTDLRVVVDRDDAFVETDETNNAGGFSPTSRSSVPSPGLAALVLSTAAAAGARRLLRRP